jgi:serine/threonine-protein kinase
MGRFLIGTPRYMQPEQLLTGKLTPASDVYTLATILYELLTGHSMFFPDEPLSVVRERLRNDPLPWIEAHARRTVVPITQHRAAASVPAELVALINACLDKDPERRPPDAGRLSLDLGQLLHYEYGAIMAATLRIVHPYGGHDEVLLLPGSHRIGSGEQCEIRLAGAEVRRVHAILEWSGLPDYPQLRPLVGDGSVRINGVPIERRARLGPGDDLEIGPFRIEPQFPS